MVLHPRYLVIWSVVFVIFFVKVPLYAGSCDRIKALDPYTFRDLSTKDRELVHDYSFIRRNGGSAFVFEYRSQSSQKVYDGVYLLLQKMPQSSDASSNSIFLNDTRFRKKLEEQIKQSKVIVNFHASYIAPIRGEVVGTKEVFSTDSTVFAGDIENCFGRSKNSEIIIVTPFLDFHGFIHEIRHFDDVVSGRISDFYKMISSFSSLDDNQRESLMAYCREQTAYNAQLVSAKDPKYKDFAQYYGMTAGGRPDESIRRTNWERFQQEIYPIMWREAHSMVIQSNLVTLVELKGNNRAGFIQYRQGILTCSDPGPLAPLDSFGAALNN